MNFHKAYNTVLNLTVDADMHFNYSQKICCLLERKKEHFNKYTYFLVDSQKAHHYSSAQCLMRLYDKSRGVLSIKVFLEFLKNEINTYTNDARYSSQIDNDLAQIDDMMNKLPFLFAIRNKHHSHSDIEYFNNDDGIYSIKFLTIDRSKPNFSTLYLEIKHVDALLISCFIRDPLCLLEIPINKTNYQYFQELYDAVLTKDDSKVSSDCYAAILEKISDSKYDDNVRTKIEINENEIQELINVTKKVVSGYVPLFLPSDKNFENYLHPSDLIENILQVLENSCFDLQY